LATNRISTPIAIHFLRILCILWFISDDLKELWFLQMPVGMVMAELWFLQTHVEQLIAELGFL
jgi:hypothetical protein